MTEQMARSLATMLVGEVRRAMPGSRKWEVLASCSDGRFVAIEDHSG